MNNSITLTECTIDELLKLDEDQLLANSKKYDQIQNDLHFLNDALQLLNKQNQLVNTNLQTIDNNIQSITQNITNSEKELSNASTIQHSYFKRNFTAGFLIGISGCLLLTPPTTLVGLLSTTVVSSVTGYLWSN